jgi:hypothetical protein
MPHHMPGHILVRCDDCGDEFELSEGCDLVVTCAEMFAFTAAHDGHGAFAIQMRTGESPA